MAYNKTKLIEAAQKYLQQGKIHQAIGEYKQILKHEPRDQVILMTIGDLLVRQGETFQALEYFERLAQVFVNDGFTTKAIAIYKKIAKLAPEESKPLEHLAELYVQQGVLSEARPLYLQMAEAHLKAGRQQQAAALLRRLLEAEPDNLRVQLRMAELCVAMGQPDEALEAYRGAAQRLLDQGDTVEALRVVARGLEIDAQHPAILLLKARALISSGKQSEAVALLESLPGIETGEIAAELLIAEYLSAGTFAPAIALAEKIFARDAKKFRPAHQVADALLEDGEFEPALGLLNRIRATMTEADHEGLERSLDRAAEKMPDRFEPLEWMIELLGRNNDSFRLPDVLARLAQAAERAGDLERARVAYEQLLDRNPEDEATRRRYVLLRERLGLEPVTDATPFVKLAPKEAAPAPPPPPADPPLDDETQRVVMQALTDVDLFSSYGLTQKAIELLEEVRQRAPSHAPILERLLDMHLGAGEERRTADLAAQLEQIWLSRGDRERAERFTELRRRFDRAADASSDEPAPNHAQRVASPVRAERVVSDDTTRAADPQEFSVPLIEAEADAAVAPPAPAHPEFEVHATPKEAPLEDSGKKEDAIQEVDLSEEWAALSEELEATAAAEPAVAAANVPETVEHASSVVPVNAAPVSIPVGASREESSASSIERAFELDDSAASHTLSDDDISSERLLADLATGFDDIAALLVGEAPAEPETPPPAGVPPVSASASSEIAAAAPPVADIPVVEIPVAANPETPAPERIAAPSAVNAAPPHTPAKVVDYLHEVFEEFRAELGEMDGKDEDIETHYNLGVAYREMGLLEEAISEFQKVAKASKRGEAFRYALQCCTLLGLSFMEKGQPAIAAMWYQRALQIPDLDQETQLALHYDLGVAQDLSGDPVAALKNFAEVYATNIDYRDVAERLAALDKAR
jgi:tetratricopeptide (TPR) repeat protein